MTQKTSTLLVRSACSVAMAALAVAFASGNAHAVPGAAVPEPSAFALAGAGLVPLLLVRLKRR